MSHTLTGWKEIAQYLGRGVRTVQRWELELGLPIRRPKNGSKGTVFVSAEDIDQWLHQQSAERSDNLKQELEKLCAALSEVTAENQVLRKEVTRLQGQMTERPKAVVEIAARLVFEEWLPCCSDARRDD